jgi:hypothetical protein
VRQQPHTLPFPYDSRQQLGANGNQTLSESSGVSSGLGLGILPQRSRSGGGPSENHPLLIATNSFAQSPATTLSGCVAISEPTADTPGAEAATVTQLQLAHSPRGLAYSAANLSPNSAASILSPNALIDVERDCALMPECGSSGCTSVRCCNSLPQPASPRPICAVLSPHEGTPYAPLGPLVASRGSIEIARQADDTVATESVRFDTSNSVGSASYNKLPLLEAARAMLDSRVSSSSECELLGHASTVNVGAGSASAQYSVVVLNGKSAFETSIDHEDGRFDMCASVSYDNSTLISCSELGFGAAAFASASSPIFPAAGCSTPAGEQSVVGASISLQIATGQKTASERPSDRDLSSIATHALNSRSSASDHPALEMALSLKDLVDYALQVASGMAFLASQKVRANS